MLCINLSEYGTSMESWGRLQTRQLLITNGLVQHGPCFVTLVKTTQNYNLAFFMSTSKMKKVNKYHFLFTTDYNECDNFGYNCPQGSSCVNNDGSYTCRCNSGYRRNAAGNCSGL